MNVKLIAVKSLPEVKLIRIKSFWEAEEISSMLVVQFIT